MQDFAQFADSANWSRKTGVGSRRVLPNEESDTQAYWIVDEPDGSYFVITFDKREADYSGKQWRACKDGDGEEVIRELTPVEALGYAMFKGLYRDGLGGTK